MLEYPKDRGSKIPGQGGDNCIEKNQTIAETRRVGSSRVCLELIKNNR